MNALVIFASVMAAVNAGYFGQSAYNAGWSSQGKTQVAIAHEPTYGYHGPQHVPILDKHGVPVETPEVQHAKQQHLQAHNLAKLQQYNNGWKQQNGWQQQQNGWQQQQQQQGLYGHQNAYGQQYSGVYGYAHAPSLTAHGVPEDTPEVKIARAQHLAAYAHEQAKHAQWEGQGKYTDWSGSHY